MADKMIKINDKYYDIDECLENLKIFCEETKKKQALKEMWLSNLRREGVEDA